jgi:hypothetical protein
VSAVAELERQIAAARSLIAYQQRELDAAARENRALTTAAYQLVGDVGHLFGRRGTVAAVASSAHAMLGVMDGEIAI